MQLIRNGLVVPEDRWVYLTDDQDLVDRSGSNGIIVSLDRWTRERGALLFHDLGIRLGVQLQADQSPALIGADLPHIALVALEFPAFKDGRAFTYARLLRERYGFAGEVRAVGNVLRDQFQFMVRCGFDALEVEKESDATAWLAASREANVIYQPTGDRAPWAMTLRQRRLAAVE